MKTTAPDITRKILQLQATARRLAADIQGPWIISKEQQQKELKTLGRLVAHEHFFFVADLRSYSIIHSGGIAQWLGYNENDFTMLDYIRIHHPSSVDATILKASIIYELVCSAKLKSSFMHSKFIVQHALRHADGNYIWVKRISTPFQMNAKGQVTEYLNKFTIIGPYTNEAVTGRFADVDGAYDELVLPVMRQRARKLLPFSEQEYNVLKMIASHPGAVAEEIANLLCIEKNTLNTYKQRLLVKAREYAQLPFKDAAEVADFFKRQGMV